MRIIIIFFANIKLFNQISNRFINYFTIFIKNSNNKKKEGIQIKYPTGLIEGLVIDELLRRFEHLIDLKLLESYKVEV